MFGFGNLQCGAVVSKLGGAFGVVTLWTTLNFSDGVLLMEFDFGCCWFVGRKLSGGCGELLQRIFRD
jgi:hypothetical protein